MENGNGKFRKRPFQPPVGESAMAVSLREIGRDVSKRKSAAALSRANQLLSDMGSNEIDRARILGQVGDSEFYRGRYEAAAQVHLQAATKSLGHPRLWLRPLVGHVRALLKVPHVDQAAIMARHAVDTAEAKMEDFNRQVRLANRTLIA